MTMCPRHGRLLYGDSCVGCDCGGPPRPPRPFLRPALDEIRIERPDLFETSIPREAIEELARRQRETVEAAIYGSLRDPPWGYEPPRHHNCRSTYHAPDVEIITNPADQRGLDAHPARVPA